MSWEEFVCPLCKIPVESEKDDVKDHPHCFRCGKNWCPNSTLKWHGPVELKATMNSRGRYYYCPTCHWYSGIDKESEESIISQKIFIETLKTLINSLDKYKDKIDLNHIAFRSKLAGEEPWYSLGERLQKYGKVRTSDLELIYQGRLITKFEIKGWKNYDANHFYFTKRAHVNIDEVEDAAKVEGYICFITLQDQSVICTRATDIIAEWEKTKIKIPMMHEEDVLRKVLECFSKGALVVIAPDKQGNYRYVLSRDYKRKYCKHLRDHIQEIADRIISKD